MVKVFFLFKEIKLEVTLRHSGIEVQTAGPAMFTFVVIAAVEELNLLESVWRGTVGRNVGMQGQESVEGGGACLLGSYDEESGQLLAGFVVRPDLHVTIVQAGIL